MKKLSKTKQQFLDANGWDMKNFIFQLKELFDDEDLNSKTNSTIGRAMFYMEARDQRQWYCGNLLKFYTNLRDVNTDWMLVLCKYNNELARFHKDCKASEIKDFVMGYFSRYDLQK